MAAHSYVCGASDHPLWAVTIGRELDQVAAGHPVNEALVSRHQGIRFTYAELHAAALEAARAFLAHGVAKGERVGIWSANRAEWVIVQYATAKIGAILVNVNPAYRTHELTYALQRSGVSLLVAARGFRQTDYRPMLEEVRPRLTELREIVLLDPIEGGRAAGLAGAIGWADFLRSAALTSEVDLREREAELDFDHPINIQYTSGTTGFPKGATLSHHNILNNGFFVGERLRLTPRDRICLPVPFYHCFGMVLGNLAALTHGATIVLPGEAFDAGAVLETVEAERCTALYGVPMMFIAVLEHPDVGRRDLATLRTGIMAGAPCPVETMRQVLDRLHLPEVTICYGMTETSPVSFQSEPDDPLEARVATVGSVHPWVECKIVDPGTGRTVPRGTPGELCTRGYLVMLGYWGDEEATRGAIDAARWMHSGDLAVMRPDGYVNIVGRLKEMIIRGGENIYPREIEEFLRGHPAIADVGVIGVPDAKYGEQVCAWVRLREGVTATAEEIQAFCRGRIATYKIPRYVRFTEEFPVTVTGKVQKFHMREISIAELGLEEAAAVRSA